MSITDPRLLFPLAPVIAVLALSMCGVLGSAHGFNSGPQVAPASLHAQPMAACCQKMPSRGPAAPKYSVKFIGHNFNGVDYDAGGGMLEINCSFEDLDSAHPVVAMSSLGLLRRIQTDTGAVADGSDGFGIINPAIQTFKNAHFQVRAKVPLTTRAVMMLNGSLTVLRARERANLLWREPYGAELNSVKKSGGFELVLAKIDTDGETFGAEWNCRPDPDALIDADFWTRRQLKSALVFADKTSATVVRGSETPYLIQRVYKLDKKFPVSLELNFISDLRTENLPFTLTNLQFGGENDKKPASGSGQNF